MLHKIIAFNLVLTVICLALLIWIGMRMSTPAQAILAVDQNGVPLATIEWFDPSHRSNEEVLRSVRYFLRHHLSMNSDRFMTDKEVAFGMMSPGFKAQEIAVIEETNAIKIITDAHMRSQIDLTQLAIVSREGKQLSVLAKGSILVQREQLTAKPFSFLLKVSLMPRTENNTHGLQILDIEDA